MISNSNKAAMEEADMAKPIPMSKQAIDTNRKEIATIKALAIHMPNKQATPMPHNPLRHNRPMEADSNRETTIVDTGRLKQRMVAVLHIQAVRPPAATVRRMNGDDNIGMKINEH